MEPVKYILKSQMYESVRDRVTTRVWLYMYNRVRVPARVWLRVYNHVRSRVEFS